MKCLSLLVIIAFASSLFASQNEIKFFDIISMANQKKENLIKTINEKVMHFHKSNEGVTTSIYNHPFLISGTFGTVTLMLRRNFSTSFLVTIVGVVFTKALAHKVLLNGQNPHVHHGAFLTYDSILKRPECKIPAISNETKS